MTEIEIAELQKKAHAYDSAQGRLAKVQSDLDAERQARLAAEARIATQPGAQIDGRAAEIFGADGVTILQSMFGQVAGKLDTLTRMHEERVNAETQVQAERKFKMELGAKLADNNLPGFESRIYGGDLAATWTKFVDARPSIRRAQTEGDVETVSDVMFNFIQQNKELVAGSGYSPNALPGGSPAVKVDYSEADYMRDIAALEQQRDNVIITEQDFNVKSAGLYDRYVAAQQKAEKAAQAFGLV